MLKSLVLAITFFVTCMANGIEKQLTSSSWLLPSGFDEAKNTTIEFRSEFEADESGTAQLVISADAVYSVRLNGKEVVATARLPDVLPHRFYDVWQVKGIQKGKNILEFSVYSIGIDTSHFRKGIPGLRFVLSGDGCKVMSSDPIKWRYSTRDIAEGVPLLSSQLGYTFEYDASRKEEEWQPYTPHSPLATHHTSLSRRPFAPPTTLPFIAAKIVSEGTLKDTAIPTLPSVGIDNALRLSTSPSPHSFASFSTPTHYYLLDLGREEVGLFEMEIETDEGVVVDIGHAEHSENGRIITNMGGRNFAGRYRARDGRQTFTRWQYRMAGRFIMLDVRNVKTHFVLHRAGLRPVMRNDVALAPIPKGLNERQQAIWKTAVRTLMLCMHEHYEDCPWREQSLYANDGRIQMLVGKCAFENDAAFAGHSFDLLARGLDEKDGWIELCMPGRVSITIPSFTFSWLLAVADYERIYKAKGWKREKVNQIMARRISEMRDGLLPCPKGKRYWQFYDWASGLSGDISGSKDAGDIFDAPLNLLFLQALESFKNEKWQAIAKELRKQIVAKFWDKEKQCFITHSMNTGKTPNYHELTQSLALLNDCVPEKSRMAVAKKLSRKSEWVETTLSQSLQKYDALLKASPEFKDVVINSIDEEWGRMLDAGATAFWEVREGWKAFNKAGSLCHGWSTIPIYFYSKLMK